MANRMFEKSISVDGYFSSGVIDCTLYGCYESIDFDHFVLQNSSCHYNVQGTDLGCVCTRVSTQVQLISGRKSSFQSTNGCGLSQSGLQSGLGAFMLFKGWKQQSCSYHHLHCFTNYCLKGNRHTDFTFLFYCVIL